jgi:hypothetical protein
MWSTELAGKGSWEGVDGGAEVHLELVKFQIMESKQD